MKNLKLILASLFFLAITFTTMAQDTKSDYFVGDWKVVVKGTPSGDAEMVMHLERLDGKLVGEMRAEGIEASKFSQVSEKETSVTVYYSTMGYDINISLDKVDENNLKGSLIGMFDATGERILEE
ncbi:hypothetical protein [Draconibacterium halophilum]|uniref:Uncharacterized protein n=1 Tax=Draconibacterium halophilum TaxID=2706887 RepID=A0A6C0RD61_9BACT|nr:hypothetical protein [Draconibacterium halophilum]QIA07665.1 hypothetical protein G0Q07_07965 [Draconibacterium halophilum]